MGCCITVIADVGTPERHFLLQKHLSSSRLMSKISNSKEESIDPILHLRYCPWTLLALGKKSTRSSIGCRYDPF